MNEWTTTPPTEPGVYWVRLPYGKIRAVEFSEGRVWQFGDEVYEKVKFFTHWLGPLPVPPPPIDK